MKKTFTGHAKLFLMISGAIVALALILQVAGLGMNIGIDFTGGSILEYSVGENFDVDDVATILASVGYTDAQITKVAPSAASVALQAGDEAQAPADPEATANAAAEPTETLADAAAVPTETPADAEATLEPTEAPAASLLNADKSGIVEDGLTDLQIRLRLVDEVKNMDVCATMAVQSVAPGAKLTNYDQLTYLAITNGGYDKSFSGGYVLEFDMGGAFDLAQAEKSLKTALSENGYSIENMQVTAFDPAAEAAKAEASTEEPADEANTENTAEIPEATEAPAETAAKGASLRVLLDVNDTTSQVRSLLEREMTAKYPGFHFISIDHVSAIAGHDLLSNAVKALLLAFVCMLIYIAIRFDVFSGLAAMFALLHDVVIMCAIMVVARAFFQVNSSFIAAVLTIVGYSINNTIIIFDRIRENTAKPGMTQLSRMDVVESSVASTLSRTINTTLTTLISLVCLYIFGVASIREFAFPLIVGMLAGTYSSILLSGQVWAMWMDKFSAYRASKKA